MLTGSHSNSWVRGAYDECLRIMDANGEYLWHDVFPDVQVSSTNAKDCRIDLDKRKRFETLEFTSIGTGNAGLYRAQTLLYCDDLVSGIEVAMSRERLDKLWEIYNTDLRQRKIGARCKELHIATRWSVADCIGRLEMEYGDNDRALFIVMPAVDENDESNFDYPYDVGFSTKFYHEQREIMDDVNWRALYMSVPVEREGLLYSADELRRYFELPEGEPDAIIAVCDTKDRGADYFCMPVAYQYGPDFYIDGVICDNGNPDVVEPRLADMLVNRQVHLARFESNQAGGRIATSVQEKVKEAGGRCKITTKYTTANKETKVIVASPWVKEHCLFKDDSVIKKDKEYRRFMQFLCGYTMGGKNKHDDVPDAMAQLAEYIQSFAMNKVEIVKRPF
jgi:predicted phage terminase large subunit-like protein